MNAAAVVDWPELEALAANGLGWAPTGGAAALPLPAASDDEDFFGFSLGVTVQGSAASPPPRATQAPPAPHAPRCLDSLHAARCARCVPAPALESQERWVLRREGVPPTRQPLLAARVLCATSPPRPRAGRTTGEKKLRALLCRTPEWRCASTREAAARHADASGLPELAHALRAHNLALLRKRDFLAVCAFWNLRSDVWAPVKSKSRRLQALPLPAPLPPPAAADGGAAAALVRRDAGAAFASFSLRQKMPGLSAAAAAEPCAPICTLDFDVRAHRPADGPLHAHPCADACRGRADHPRDEPHSALCARGAAG